MRRSVPAGAVLLCLSLALAAATAGRAPGGVGADSHLTVIEVTNAGDGPGICPSEAGCTLRAAIGHVNVVASEGDVFEIRFASAVFNEPQIIALAGAPLPAIAVPDVTIDGGGQPIVIDGSGLQGEEPVDGLVLAGAGTAVRGLAIRGFSGRCLVLDGEGSAAGGPGALHAVYVGQCATGILVRGDRSIVSGTAVGFDAIGAGLPVGTGIAVEAADVVVGVPADETEGRNAIGNAATAIRAGGGEEATTGLRVAGNVIGRYFGDAAAPVTADGLLIASPATGVVVENNTIANCRRSGVRIVADGRPDPPVANTLRGNTFIAIGDLAIDLQGDGLRNPNDPDDTDGGPNGLQNHPVITRALPGLVAGVVPGCASCSVELAIADHRPGQVVEPGYAPVPVTAAVTDAGGAFVFGGLALAPGTWVSALATGADGSTSEFGLSYRVGEGAIVCGATGLVAGWNHAGYFGAPVALGDSFPAGPGGGMIVTIYELVDGGGAYRVWSRETAVGRSLHSLVPGSTYWFYAEQPVQLAGGFQISTPVPVELKAGFNDFLYLGATGDWRDALRSIPGLHGDLYHFEAGGSGGWRWAGGPATPAWAADFSDLVACRTYYVSAPADVMFMPLQP